ncbi:hypothetical protein PF005_g17394 [Phytophthora fragariae]|uniref:Secreted protein n=1 Tax=Phytophthora fragariae TaxID=53985 RepID=A0A6A3ECN4_9STRA|nr:hypothetical protein PF003_g29600 [Phytophthora fragariae]KAE8929936.1 hypothetical protein PF009_g19965 [Phytophthora fragariae]KAE8991738.1 hypothetical protein PF011_g17825 [Phytophthora fragariae]KAE9094050.1 hypothetical protein PF010_g17250 [Phytophthora fragariae]KAE9095084.1 hypothetical protein PF007_g17520 [Phytophthora fragariae]
MILCCSLLPGMFNLYWFLCRNSSASASCCTVVSRLELKVGGVTLGHVVRVQDQQSLEVAVVDGENLGRGPF